MKQVFTHENRFIVSNAKNILDEAGISTWLKNEYAAGAAGDLAPFDTWLEVWVERDRDYDLACRLIAAAFAPSQDPQWLCQQCGEENEPSFDFCWSCQANYPNLS